FQLWPHLLEAEGRLIKEVEMRAPSGESVVLKLVEPFAIYSRRTFDQFLRDRAELSGAQIFTEHVNIFAERNSWAAQMKNGETICAPVVIAANGANSGLARKLAGALSSSEMEVAFGYRAPLPDSSNSTTVVAFLPGWAGYAWAFPRLDHVSFGIATPQGTFDHKALDIMLWEFMIDYYDGQHRTAAERAKIEQRLRVSVDTYAARIPGLSAETLDRRRTVGDNWALLGDAAGFADPVTGEGIYYALRSAELLASSFVSGNLLNYEESWRSDFGLELRRAAQIRDRFYGNFFGRPFTSRMIQFSRLHRGIRKTMLELVTGAQGYLGLKRKLARRAVWPY
ncbi:MAG: NAD(P)/FAD-dependent oxidoreductase, partial [Pyrinomonadaceae bacterium]